MQEKIKIITIKNYQNSILEDYFKDNENIRFLELASNENVEKFNNNISGNDIIFLRTNEENIEKLLEIGKALKEKGIIIATVLEEKIVMKNKEVLENSINAIFPVTKKEDIENLLLEIIKMVSNIAFEDGFINLDFEDIKSILKDSGIAIFGSLNIKKQIIEKELINNVNYPFHNKTLKDSKKILIHLDALQGTGMAEGQLITDILRNESGKKIEDIMFSLRMDNNLKNRIECSFVAGKFRNE